MIKKKSNLTLLLDADAPAAMGEILVQSYNPGSPANCVSSSLIPLPFSTVRFWLFRRDSAVSLLYTLSGVAGDGPSSPVAVGVANTLVGAESVESQSDH